MYFTAERAETDMSSICTSSNNHDEENPPVVAEANDNYGPPDVTPAAPDAARQPLLPQGPPPSYDSTAGPGLHTFAYLIDPEIGLRESTVSAALHRRHRSDDDGATATMTSNDDNHHHRQQPPQQHAWIDAILYGDDDDKSNRSYHELRRLIFNEITVSSFLRRHLNQPNLLHTPQVLSLTNALLMVMRIINDSDEYGASHHGEGSAAAYTAVLCLEEGLLVSATKVTAPSSFSATTSRTSSKLNRRGGAIDNNRHHHDVSWRHEQHTSCRLLSLGGLDTSTTEGGGAGSFLDRELVDNSLSGCLVMYLSYHLEETASAAHLVRDRVMAMLERLDHDIASVTLQQVVELKNKVMRLSAVAEEQNQCMTRLADADSSNDSFRFVKGSVNVLLSMAGSTERMIDRLEARMADIRSGYEAHQQERIKKRLNLLTIMSAVFLPLTLMAGIWGMNFQHMPELPTEYGYYYALASMAAVALGLMSCFYWNGWLS